jgi:hypothetical protein
MDFIKFFKKIPLNPPFSKWEGINTFLKGEKDLEGWE